MEIEPHGQREPGRFDARVERESSRQRPRAGGEALPHDGAELEHRGNGAAEPDGGARRSELAHDVVARAADDESLRVRHRCRCSAPAKGHAHVFAVAHPAGHGRLAQPVLAEPELGGGERVDVAHRP